ncbi:MAG: recombinase RecT [Verrucomicrobiota bacterium]
MSSSLSPKPEQDELPLLSAKGSTRESGAVLEEPKKKPTGTAKPPSNTTGNGSEPASSAPPASTSSKPEAPPVVQTALERVVPGVDFENLPLRKLLEQDEVNTKLCQSVPADVGDSERFTQMLLVHAATAVSRSAKLQQAVTSPVGKASFIRCLSECAELGLYPSKRHAHLVPYEIFENRRPTGKFEVNLIVDYKGWVQVLYQRAHCEAVFGGVVYEGDEFTYELAPVPKVTHRPSLKKKGERAPTHIWSCVILPGGFQHYHVMDIEDVELRRMKSKSFYKGQFSGPNAEFPDEMRKRTCLRTHTKFLPELTGVGRLVDIENTNDPILENPTARANPQLVLPDKTADDSNNEPEEGAK